VSDSKRRFSIADPSGDVKDDPSNVAGSDDANDDYSNVDR